MNLKINIILIAIGFLIAFSSCDKGFDELNRSPIALTSINPGYQLNKAIINSSFTLSQIQGETSIIKQQARVFTGVGALGNFNFDGRETSSSNWNRGYQNMKDLVDLIENVKTIPENVNIYNMARIWRAYTVMIITDSYGNVPYSEAGLGFLENTVKPAYDKQSEIYQNILNELESASGGLDNSLNDPATISDILFGGDIGKWKRLGYSLLLRAAMRLTKVDAETAEKFVKIAVEKGIQQSNGDNCLLLHNGSFPNDVGQSLNGGQSYFSYLVKDFVDYLKTNEDPRLGSIAVRYVGATNLGDQIETNADRNPEDQIGMPMGYDNTNIGPIAEADGLPSFYAYSQLDRTRMASSTAPTFFVTYTQTQLLLAEAIYRNWVTGDIKQTFLDAVRADMERYASYGSSTAISELAISSYLNNHHLTDDKELEEINTQYWVASYLNGPEGWANFRRSGYPALMPNPLHGDLSPDEDFMRRFGYPQSELVVNKENVDKAISDQGPDNISTRVWWDKK